ncbi:MAG: hypothetical protein ACM3UU_10055 [Ignavibacteriales bacterium]
MREIFIYTSPDQWDKDEPFSSVKGDVINKTEKYIEIIDENGYTQIINIDKVFAIVYK